MCVLFVFVFVYVYVYVYVFVSVCVRQHTYIYEHAYNIIVHIKDKRTQLSEAQGKRLGFRV